MDRPSGTYTGSNNIEIAGWIVTNEQAISYVMAEISGYPDQLSLAIESASDVEAVYGGTHKYIKRFRGAIDRSKLSTGDHTYKIWSSVSDGSTTGSFAVGGASVPASTPNPAVCVMHLDSPSTSGAYNGYNHIELKGWIATNSTVSYIMSEITEAGVQYNMDFSKKTDESYPGYANFYRFYTVINRDLLASNQTYTVKVWSSLGEIMVSSFNTGNVDPVKYTISFNANGGNGTPASIVAKQESTVALPSTKPTRTGYTFLGWSTSASATSASYSAGQSFVITKNLALYAVWKPNTYTVSYNANGGTGAPASQTKTHGTALTLSGTVPTREGYIFLGWDTDTETVTPFIQPGEQLRMEGNVTLYAIWQAKTYSVVYLNGVLDQTEILPAQVKTHDMDLIIPADVPTKEGYTFLGWIAETGSEVDYDRYYQPGDVYSGNADTRMFAQWEKIPVYAITFNANGGSGAPENISGEENSTVILPEIVPTREGYTFLGWNTLSIAVSAEYHGGDSLVLTANQTLYAVWEKSFDGIAEGISGGCTWTIDNNGVLTVKPTDGKSGMMEMATPWANYAEDIQKAVFKSGVILPMNSNSMFEDCINLTEVNLSRADTSQVTDMGSMFYLCKSLTVAELFGIDTSNVTDMSYMFASCTSLTELDLTGIDTSNVTSMKGMFQGCSSVAELDLSGFDTSKVTDMQWMFYRCQSMNVIDVSGFDTSSVVYMNSMFYLCDEVRELDLTGFDTSKVTNVSGIFKQCTALEKVSVGAKCAVSLELPGEYISSADKAVYTATVPNVAAVYTVRGAEIFGDLTGDGVVDKNDVKLLFRHLVLPDLYPTSYTGDLDFNEDGQYDIRDAQYLLDEMERVG